MPVTDIRDDAHFQSCMAGAGSKLVVVDFTAKWCGPCRQITPIYESLSNKYPQAAFLKVDVDKCGQVAASNNITAMPTFIFFRARTRVARIQGAQPQALEAKIIELIGQDSNSNTTGESSGGQSYGPHIDLTTLITKGGCECLNESDDHPLAHCLDGRKDTYLESDCDEQLIITIAFSQPIKLHSLKLRASEGFGPKTLKLFLNQPTSLDFDKAESSEPVQSIELNPDDLTEDAKPVQLKYVKFQNVNSLTIFVRDNQSGQETTRISQFILIGSPVAATNMSEFKRVGDAICSGDVGRIDRKSKIRAVLMNGVTTHNETVVLDDTKQLFNTRQHCEEPWTETWIYIYLFSSVSLFVAGVIGMLTTAYNRSGTSKRRIYSAKGI